MSIDAKQSVQITSDNLPPVVEVTKKDWRKFRFYLENGDSIDVYFDYKGVLNVRSYSYPLAVLPNSSIGIVLTTLSGQ